jgi:hypothetical protein
MDSTRPEAINFNLESGITVEVSRVGHRPPERPAFFLGVPKSGSTLLHRLVEDICHKSDQELINISDSCFRAGIKERMIPDRILPGLPDTRTAFYYGFRLVGKLSRSVAFRHSPKVILVRDPRDALTSLYFSMQKSHMVPAAGESSKIIETQRQHANSETIDEFIRNGRGDFIIDAMRDIAAILWLPETYLYRYEDVILRKRDWVGHFAAAAGLEIGDDVMDLLMERHDVLPDEEVPGDHIRQVRPGNHRQHLSAETIDYIAQKGADVLRVFQYD